MVSKAVTLSAGVSTSLQAVCVPWRGLRGTLMIQPFSALTARLPPGDWGQFYRNLSFFMQGWCPECP